MGRERIQILDGGMGTTLESLGHSVSSELWGSELLHTAPDVIRGIHEGYVEAGANLVETCTYQLTQDNLSNYLSTQTSNPAKKPVEYSEESISLLRSSVDLVYDSFTPSSSTTSPGTPSCSNTKSKGVVLSCGPYGSTLRLGAEYSGFYPAPFGPNLNPTPSPSSSSASEDVEEGQGKKNYFPPTNQGNSQENEAINSLTQFHLSKLLTIASDQENWSKVEWIAFETIPVLYEVKAIRRAMGELNLILEDKYGSSSSGASFGISNSNENPEKDNGEENEKEKEKWYIKKFWITSPFPNGHFPQLQSNGFEHISVGELVNTLLDSDSGAGSEKGLIPIPNGIGINCTNPLYLSKLIRDFTQCMKLKLSSLTPPSLSSAVPPARLSSTFVLYPDGGQVYDVHTRSWSTPANGPSNAKEWSNGVMNLVYQLENEEIIIQNGDNEGSSEVNVWGGVIVGGCCKTSFGEIRALRESLDELSG